MPMGKPNILVIWGDDIGISNLSCYSDGLMGYRTGMSKVGIPGADVDWAAEDPMIRSPEPSASSSSRTPARWTPRERRPSRSFRRATSRPTSPSTTQSRHDRNS
jgi:hypothetical protein